MSSTRQAEMFVALAIAQGLIRNKYQVETEVRLQSGRRADLLAYKANETFVVELKVVQDESLVQRAVAEARRQLQKLPEIEGFVAVGVQSAQTIYLDELLRKKMKFTSDDFKAKILRSTS
ncbi:MmcB family DNA repair protein [Paracidovorax avenae]